MSTANLFDHRGWVSRDPEILEQIRIALLKELDTRISKLTLDEQEWGAGGGIHFSAVWEEDAMPVLVKIGASEREIYWSNVIVERQPDIMPTLYAYGHSLADLDIGWTVTEKIKHNCMGPQYLGNEFGMLLESAVKFQKATRGLEPEGIATLDESILGRWMENGLAENPPGPAKALARRMSKDLAWIGGVCEYEICHGDVQACNGLTRQDPPDYGPLLLIDCQPIVQPWAFDAGYLQVINSIDMGRLGFFNLIPTMNALREQYGVSTIPADELEKAAAITLGWYAIRQWHRAGERQQMPHYVTMTEYYIRCGCEEKFLPLGLA